jgi:hypothetical protein
MKIRSTEAFLTFARPVAAKYANEKGKILCLNYNYVETKESKGFIWVLGVVNRADFPGTPSMIINGWEILYQPDMKDELSDSILDFKDGQILVHPMKRTG